MRLGLNKSDILCIDWDERSLRILDTTVQRSRPTVRRAVQAPIPEGLDVRDPSVMGDFLRRTLGEHRIRTRRAIVDVPRQDTVLNRLSLPTGTMDETASMVHLQIAKELPFSKDQAVIDFAVVPNPGSPTCDVWVAAIRVNVIEYYRQVFANTGLSLERIGLRPYANVRALQSLGHQGRVVMVDIGPSMTEINILRDGELMYTRAASVIVPVLDGARAGSKTGHGNGDEVGQRTTHDADVNWSMDHLLIEVSRTIAAYRATDMGATIDRIILSGSAGADERLVQAVEERFGVSTETYSLPEGLRWRGDGDEAMAPFSAVLGLALSNVGEAGHRFDFLHVKEPEGEHRQRVKRRPVVVATVAMFAVSAAVFAYQPIRTRAKEAASLEADIAYENRDLKQRESALEKIGDLKSWQTANVPWIDYIHKLAAVFPSNQDCYITRMEVNTDKGEIALDLAAADRFMAAKTVDTINEVLDAKGKPIFKAVGGPKADFSPKDPDYPVNDLVIVKVLPVAPPPKAKGRR